MMRALVAVRIAALLFVALVPLHVAAQSESGSIRIVVNDESGKTPLDFARVVLDGPVIASELTGKNGEVYFTDVPDGVYHARIAKRDYQTITSAPFEVINGRSVTVTVTMALATNLKVIGSVSAKSSAVISTTSIGPDSAQRKLSNDLADALNKLSGVSVSTSGDDSDATQTISLEGHDASQTQLTLDGIPLNAPGTAGNLQSFATDLFSGASVRNGPQIGGLGGGVNFSTLQPTLSWMSQASLSTGSNGKYNYSAAESGSLGKLGLALQTSYRANTSLVDGMTYLDASGLDYGHDGDSTIAGNLAKMRYQFSDSQTLTGTFLNSTRNTNIVCLRITQSIPCGYGPGNTNDGNTQLYSLTDNALIGETTLQTSVYSSAFGNLNDQLNRFVNGEAQPIGFSTISRSHGFTVNATLPERERHTISLQAYGSWGDQSTVPLVIQAAPFYTGSQQTNYSALQLTDSIQSNDKLTLNESIGVSRALHSASSALGSLSASWKPTTHDTYTASYTIGGLAPAPSRSTILTDPASLRFDCNGNVAYGNAPGDSPAESSSITQRVGYTRSLRGGSFSLQLFHQVQNGVVLPVQVNGSVFAANGVISAAYLAAVAKIYASPAGCNNATPFTASQLYFSSPVGGVTRVYEGGSISGFVSLGGLVVQPFWNVNVSKAISNDPRINNPYSITISAEQLPNIPLQRGGIVLDYKARHSALEWLADAQYTGRNNPNNLPAYTEFDAAVSAELTHGTLTLAASNITNVYSGIFASPQNALPYYTQNGIAIPTIARPLAPRNYSFTYTARFGQGAVGAVRAPSPIRSREGGGFRSGPAPLPSSAPSNPLDAQTGSQFCNADAEAAAQKISGELKAYVAQIEAAKTASGYPATMPAPALDDATVTYHGLGDTYALSISPKVAPQSGATTGTLASTIVNGTNAQAQRGTQGVPNARGRGGAFRVFFGCLQLHIAQPDEIAARHLYTPTSGIFGAPQITFMPSVGLYAQARAQQAGQESFRVYALPSAPPSDPFQLRANASECSADLRGTATEALAELRSYFASGAKTPMWTITAHQSKSGTWYELEPGDPSAIAALLTCGRVAAAQPQDIVARGWDGMLPPAVNFARPLGLYIVRPAPRPTQ